MSQKQPPKGKPEKKEGEAEKTEPAKKGAAAPKKGAPPPKQAQEGKGEKAAVPKKGPAAKPAEVAPKTAAEPKKGQAAKPADAPKTGEAPKKTAPPKKAAAPKTDAPKTAAPKTVQPKKAAAPKTAAPKTVAPKKAAAPKTDAPKEGDAPKVATRPRRVAGQPFRKGVTKKYKPNQTVKPKPKPKQRLPAKRKSDTAQKEGETAEGEGKKKKVRPPKRIKPTKVTPAEGGDVPPVPESKLKRDAMNAELKKRAASRKRFLDKKQKIKRKLIFKRAQKYEKQYQRAEKHLVSIRRFARRNNIFYVEPEAKIALLIRIKGLMGVSPKVRKVLQLLRLRQINNAVFVKLNKPMLQMMKIAEPYITWGYPNFKTVRELFYKRGFAKVDGQRIPITSNKIIERGLKNCNILCAEDLIHEIYTCGPHFKQANSFLWPFKLSNPTGGWVQKNIHFAEGGDAGNRELFINKLVQQMN